MSLCIPSLHPLTAVYGLAAHAMDAQAARKIFQVKQRPADNPLIVHVDGERMLHECCGLSVDPVYRPLIERFWPGPLTILLRRRTLDGSSVNADFYAELDADLDRALEAPEIPREVTQTEMVAVRLPAHPVARALITMSGLPLVCRSVTCSGSLAC